MREQIIQLAREAGAACFGKDGTYGNYSAGSVLFTPTELERFAELVAKHEREMCALVVEADLFPAAKTQYQLAYNEGVSRVAAAIRARGKQ